MQAFRMLQIAISMLIDSGLAQCNAVRDRPKRPFIRPAFSTSQIESGQPLAAEARRAALGCFYLSSV